MAMYVSSNRTWSLPLPVAPWATASAPVSRATATWCLAMIGRATLVPQQVIRLVRGMGAEHGKAELLGELLAQVFDDHLIGPAGAGFLFDAAQFVTLAKIGGERNQLDAGISFLEPRKDDAGIQSAAVGQDDLSRVGGVVAMGMVSP